MSDYTATEIAFIETPRDDYERKFPEISRDNRERALLRYRSFRDAVEAGTWEPRYSNWRHGGSYVDNIVYPSGAVGCIASSRHTRSGRFEIACSPAEHDEKYRTRDEAARAEAEIALSQWADALREEVASVANAVATLADVMDQTEDADDLYEAFQWVEVAAIANVLHASGASRVAAEMVARWTAVNGHVIEVDEVATPADLTASFGAISCSECGTPVFPTEAVPKPSICEACAAVAPMFDVDEAGELQTW